MPDIAHMHAMRAAFCESKVGIGKRKRLCSAFCHIFVQPTSHSRWAQRITGMQQRTTESDSRYTGGYIGSGRALAIRGRSNRM